MSGSTNLGARSDREFAIDQAKADAIRSDAVTRQTVGKWMIGGFAIANIFVLFLILRMFEVDHDLLLAKVIPSSDRVIDSKTIMALIAGTTAQLGALALIIGKYLFPAGSSDAGK